MAYAELQATSNYSFLRGASHPGELVLAAKALGLAAIGIADRNTLAGVVRAWAKGREIGQRVLVGARLDFTDATPSVVCYPTDREAWGRLTRLLTVGQRRAVKGECHLTGADLDAHGEGQLVLIVPPPRLEEAFEAEVTRLAGAFPGRAWLLASRPYSARDLKRIHSHICAVAYPALEAAGEIQSSRLKDREPAVQGTTGKGISETSLP